MQARQRISFTGRIVPTLADVDYSVFVAYALIIATWSFCMAAVVGPWALRRRTDNERSKWHVSLRGLFVRTFRAEMEVERPKIVGDVETILAGGALKSAELAPTPDAPKYLYQKYELGKTGPTETSKREYERLLVTKELTVERVQVGTGWGFARKERKPVVKFGPFEFG